MPTGYTADVGSGAVSDFRTFALRCARAFGAAVMQRDDPMNDPPKHREESPHYAASLAAAKARLAEVEAMAATAAQEASDHEYARLVGDHERHCTDTKNEMGRYRAMLAEVGAWEPPTADHVALKKFMQEQLRTSIGYDDMKWEAPAHLSGEMWRAVELSKVRSNITYHEKNLREERERVSKANQWIDALYAALPVENQ